MDSLVSIIDNKRLFGENWMCILVSDHGGDGYSHEIIIILKLEKLFLLSKFQITT